MPWPARCTREECKARCPIARPPEQYVRPPKCDRCGSPLRIDRWRLAHERKQRPCNCLGYSFPHRPTSLHCDSNPNLTPEMMRDREGYS